MLDQVLAHARSGWHLFPVWWPVAPGKCACGDPDCVAPAKHPIAWLVPQGKDNATTNEQLLTSWWQRCPQANVGLAVAPSGLIVLDVDVKDGKRGMESLGALPGPLPHTLRARTGSGGFHAFYSRPAGIAPFQRIGARPGIDIIGNGYVILPPSVHVSGGLYTWTARIPIAPLPTMLADLQRERPKITTSQVGAPIREGDRNNAMFRFGAAIRSTGAGANAVRAAMHQENAARFTPPLHGAEIDQVFESVMQRVQPDRDAAMSAVVERSMLDLIGPPAVAESNIPLPDEATAMELLPSLEAKAKLPVVRLPFAKLDDKLGGLALHSMTLLLAGTGKGKSSMAGQLATYHAVSKQGPAIIYVGEMTRDLFLGRILGQILGRSWRDVSRGAVPRQDMERALHGLGLYFVKRSDRPVEAMLRACRRAAADGYTGVPLVVIDYIQLLAPITNDLRLSTIKAVRDVQQMTEECPIVTLVLSQSSRSGAQRIRLGAAQAEELGDTGAETAELERSATNQLILSFQSKDDTEVHPVTLHVAKSRFGGGSKLGFEFNGKTGLWTPTERPPADEAHDQLCADILMHVDIHAAGKCQSGVGSCGRALTANELCRVKSPHKIGSREKVLIAVQDLIELKEIRRDDGCLVRY